MGENFSYILGFSFANIIWALESLGDLSKMMFSTFTLCICLITLWLSEVKK